MSTVRACVHGSKIAQMAVLLFLVTISIWALIALADTVEIGRNGGKVRVESDLQIMFSEGGGHGGGHVTWRVSGQAAPELRTLIDQNMGNGDGNVTPVEAKVYTDSLDNWLTNSAIVYHGGKMHSFSLLDRNRGVEENTEYLIGKVSDSGAIEIRFLIEATLNTRDGDFNMNDDIFVTSLFDVLSIGVDSYVFVGDVEIVHWNYIVGFSSYSDFDVEYGKKVRFRGPVWEVYRYTVSYSGGTMGEKKDQASFDRFNVVQSPLELFIVCMVLGYFTIFIPKRYARTYRKAKVRSLHQGAWGLSILLLVIYLLGLNGMFIWVMGPLFLILIFLLSYLIYKKGWKRIAKPLSEAETKELDREEGLIRPESYRKLHPREDDDRYEDTRPSRRPVDRARPRGRRPSPKGRAHHDDEYHDDGYGDEYDDRDGYDHDEGYEEDGRYRGRPSVRERPRRQVLTDRPGPSPTPGPRTGQATIPKKAPTPPPGPPAKTPVVEVKGRVDQIHEMEPIPPPVERRKIRCAGCRKIFEAEIREKPQKVQCPICGKQGLIR